MRFLVEAGGVRTTASVCFKPLKVSQRIMGNVQKTLNFLTILQLYQVFVIFLSSTIQNNVSNFPEVSVKTACINAP